MEGGCYGGEQYLRKGSHVGRSHPESCVGGPLPLPGDPEVYLEGQEGPSSQATPVFGKDSQRQIRLFIVG